MARPYVKLGDRLADLATEFVAVADHAETLAMSDKWNRDAETLRLARHLHLTLPDDYTATAQAIADAGEKLLAAAEDELHASRMSRREAKR